MKNFDQFPCYSRGVDHPFGSETVEHPVASLLHNDRPAAVDDGADAGDVVFDGVGKVGEVAEDGFDLFTAFRSRGVIELIPLVSCAHAVEIIAEGDEPAVLGEDTGFIPTRDADGEDFAFRRAVGDVSEVSFEKAFRSGAEDAGVGFDRGCVK